MLTQNGPERSDQTKTGMSRGERETLAALVRRREKVAKAGAATRSAELLADFEQQMASRYSFNQDAVWKAAHAAADEVVKDAQARVAERCAELGIPARFAPELSVQWYSRGENATRERRTELRHVARTRVAALEKAAKTQIERRSVEVQTALYAGGLESAEAKAFLAAMPTPEELMPPLALDVLETATHARLAPGA